MVMKEPVVVPFRPRSLWITVLVVFIASSMLPDGALAQRLPESGPPPFIVTADHLVEEMIRLGGVMPGEIVYDLGSGDGRLVIAAARTGAAGVGIEIDRELVELSRELASAAGVADRVRFIEGDIFEADVRDADVVMLYLSHDFNQRLKPRLLEQLSPGSRIVSHTFHMDDWQPDSVITIGRGAGQSTLYMWQVPADLDGFWLLEVDGFDSAVLELLQDYQAVSGEIRRDGRGQRIESGQIRGREFTFEFAARVEGVATTLQFEGTLTDGVLSGTVQAGDGVEARRWRAVRFRDLGPENPSPDL